MLPIFYKVEKPPNIVETTNRFHSEVGLVVQIIAYYLKTQK